MTEIPEHLLQRSAQARARLTGEAPAAAPTAAPTESANAPAVVDSGAASAAERGPVPIPDRGATPPPAPPQKPWVRAAESRKKIPFIVMSALLFLPVWGFMYVGTNEEPERVEPVLALGGEVYAEKCASCHGGTGAGGSGPAFGGGLVVATFPGWADQIEWIDKGAELYAADGHSTYGALNTSYDAYGAVMPGFGADLNAEEIMAVTFYERIDLGGAEEELPLATAMFNAFVAGEYDFESFEGMDAGAINDALVTSEPVAAAAEALAQAAESE